MIEVIMLVALGFFSATLCWLALLPVIYKRAARLTRQAMEAIHPTSYSEIRAQHDYQRAEHALEELRLERALERERKASVQHRLGTGRLTTELVRTQAHYERELGVLRLELEKAHQQENQIDTKNLITELETLRKELHENRQELAKAKTEVSLLKSTASTPLSSQVLQSTEEATALTTIASLETQIRTLQNHIKQNNEDPDSEQADILPDDVKILHSTVGRLETELVDAEAELISAQADIARLTLQLDQTDLPQTEQAQNLKKELEWADTEKARLIAIVNNKDRSLERARTQILKLRSDLRSAPQVNSLRNEMLEISKKILSKKKTDNELYNTPDTSPSQDTAQMLVNKIIKSSREASTTEDAALKETSA